MGRIVFGAVVPERRFQLLRQILVEDRIERRQQRREDRDQEDGRQDRAADHDPIVAEDASAHLRRGRRFQNFLGGGRGGRHGT